MSVFLLEDADAAAALLTARRRRARKARSGLAVLRSLGENHPTGAPLRFVPAFGEVSPRGGRSGPSAALADPLACRSKRRLRTTARCGARWGRWWCSTPCTTMPRSSIPRSSMRSRRPRPGAHRAGCRRPIWSLGCRTCARNTSLPFPTAAPTSTSSTPCARAEAGDARACQSAFAPLVDAAGALAAPYAAVGFECATIREELDAAVPSSPASTRSRPPEGSSWRARCSRRAGTTKRRPSSGGWIPPRSKRTRSSTRSRPPWTACARCWTRRRERAPALVRGRTFGGRRRGRSGQSDPQPRRQRHRSLSAATALTSGERSVAPNRCDRRRSPRRVGDGRGSALRRDARDRRSQSPGGAGRRSSKARHRRAEAPPRRRDRRGGGCRGRRRGRGSGASPRCAFPPRTTGRGRGGRPSRPAATCRGGACSGRAWRSCAGACGDRGRGGPR